MSKNYFGNVKRERNTGDFAIVILAKSSLAQGTSRYVSL